MRNDPKLAGAFRWLLVAVYSSMGWGMCHDGTSAAELATMFVVGGIFLVLVITISWLLDGVGQIDREVPDDES